MPQIDTATWSYLYWFSVGLTFFSIRPKAHQWASLVAQMVKNLPALLESWVRSLVWEDPLEKEMATHSSILAWRIPWTDEPGGLQSTGSQRVGHNWMTLNFNYLHFICLSDLADPPVSILSFTSQILFGLRYHSGEESSVLEQQRLVFKLEVISSSLTITNTLEYYDLWEISWEQLMNFDIFSHTFNAFNVYWTFSPIALLA